MRHNQKTFNPVDYGFQWTDNWYTFDYGTARKLAKQARDKEVRELREQGHEVTCFCLSNQLITKGGIGSGRPQIEQVVSVFGYNVYYQDKE